MLGDSFVLFGKLSLFVEKTTRVWIFFIKKKDYFFIIYLMQKIFNVRWMFKFPFGLVSKEENILVNVSYSENLTILDSEFFVSFRIYICVFRS